MKKFTTTLTILSFFLVAQAQTLDTLTMGPGYTLQSWYKFETNRKSSASAGNWDLAFSTRRLDASIWVNHNAKLSRAVAPASAWSTLTVDTAALTAFQVNTDSAWFVGAFNRTGDNVFNYGWGNYNLTTHNVTGDSIYILKSATDGKWRKVLIERLALDTSYFVRFADLDGANQQTIEIKKKDFGTKNFGYYSFAQAARIDREPAAADWDITVFRYWGLTPDANGVLQEYLLTGFLHNYGVTVAKATNRNPANNSTSNLQFKSTINVIGADWKSFTGTAWKLADSTAYFVKTANGKIYKMVFTGFGGATNGNSIFTREYLLGTSVTDEVKGTAALAIAPNPATDGQIQVVFDLGKNAQNADFTLYNLAGQAVYNQKLATTEGLQTLELPFLNLSSGLYLAQIRFDGKVMNQKLVVR